MHLLCIFGFPRIFVKTRLASWDEPLTLMEMSDDVRAVAQAKEDKQTGKRPEILNLPQDIDQYDEIYLGYPNYWGIMPMAVYTFLESYDFTGKKIHPFCTHEGSGLSNTESDIKKSAKGAVIEKGIAIQGSSVDQAKDVLERWIQK